MEPSELEKQLVEFGTDLFGMPPSSVDKLLGLLDKIEQILILAKQAPPSTELALLPLKNGLIAAEILRHPDANVRVSVASCITKISAITIPNAPYNDEQMKEVFQLTVDAFEYLACANGRGYSKAISILDTVAGFKSILVMFDLELDDLVAKMFALFLKNIGPNHPDNVFLAMETIMTAIINESKDFSFGLLSPLIDSVRKDNKVVSPLSWKLGDKVISNCPTKLKPYLIEAVKSTGVGLDRFAGSIACICRSATREHKNTMQAPEPKLKRKRFVAGNETLDMRTYRSICTEERHFTSTDIMEDVEVDHLQPGPLDDHILYLQHTHRSSQIWATNGEEPGPLRATRREVTSRKLGVHITARVEQRVRDAGFYGVHRLQLFRLDWALITALIERWRQETHTFHLPHGETTITLQDVEVLMGLKVDGDVVTGRDDPITDQKYITLLGQVPSLEHRKGNRLRLRWFSDNFRELPLGAPDGVVDMYARAYIMELLGGVLFPDKSRNLVKTHFLPLLHDLTEAGRYAWGSATLACLYREMCKASCSRVTDIGGPLILLQMWAWERLPFIRPRVPRPQGAIELRGPRGCRWNVEFTVQEVSTHVLRVYRDQFDQMRHDQITWMPYTEEIINDLPLYCAEGREVWLSRVPLIFFEIVEWHLPDRVLRQFGLQQDIPQEAATEPNLHSINRIGRSPVDWAFYHRDYIRKWRNRRASVVHVMEVVDPYRPSREYREWYYRITRRIINPFDTTGAHRHQLSGGIIDTQSSDMATISWLATTILKYDLPPRALQAIRQIQAIARRSIQLDPHREWRETQFSEPTHEGTSQVDPSHIVVD